MRPRGPEDAAVTGVSSSDALLSRSVSFSVTKLVGGAAVRGVVASSEVRVGSRRDGAKASGRRAHQKREIEAGGQLREGVERQVLLTALADGLKVANGDSSLLLRDPP